MKLTTKGRFAVTAMVDIALHRNETPIRIATISERQSISYTYLEQIFCKLRRAGIVTSTRGPGGGYRLARPAVEISIASIIEAVDEDIDATQCHGGEGCTGGATCLTHHLWDELNQRMNQFLSNVTLADMVQRNYENQQQRTVHVPARIPVRQHD